MYIDETEREREALAERRRERDRHREPRRFVAAPPDLTARWAFQAAVIDQINEVAARHGNPMAVVSVRCPACGLPIPTTTDGEHERAACAGCDAALVIRRAEDGTCRAELAIGGVA